MNLNRRFFSPWLVTPAEGAPVQSWVVVALGATGDEFMASLIDQEGPSPAHQVIVVCCATSAHIAAMPRWVTAVAVAGSDEPTRSEARRVGMAQATGGVVHLVDSEDLLVGGEAAALADWATRLTDSGVEPPGKPSAPGD